MLALCYDISSHTMDEVQVLLIYFAIFCQGIDEVEVQKWIAKINMCILHSFFVKSTLLSKVNEAK